MKYFYDFEEGVREQWLDERTIKFAAGPGAVSIVRRFVKGVVAHGETAARLSLWA